MTAQAHERLIYNGEDTSMACCPDLPRHHPRIVPADKGDLAKDERAASMILYSTGCWRGYIGTWEIKEGRLYLIGTCGIYKVLGTGPIFADWFSGVLRIPRGGVLQYVHGDFLTVHEREVRVTLEQGIVVNTRVVDNRPPAGPAARSYEQGCTSLRKGDYTQSVAAFSKAIQLYPEYADAYYGRGVAFEDLGDHTRSLTDLRKVLLLEPGALRLISSIQVGVTLSAWEAARTHVERDIARVYGKRAIGRLEKGEYEKAVIDCTESVKLDAHADCQRVRLTRGRAYYALRRFKEAIPDLHAFACTNPDDPRVRHEVYSRLAHCHREIGSYAQAIFNAGIAIRLDPENPEPYLVRASAYSENGESDKAVTDFTEALRLRPGWADAYAGRARAFRAQGDEIRAAQDLSNCDPGRGVASPTSPHPGS
jgi:tetratricopeptide (TPR) repeat protein